MAAASFSLPDLLPAGASAKDVVAKLKDQLGRSTTCFSVGPRVVLAVKPLGGDGTDASALASEADNAALDIRRAMEPTCPPSIERLVTRTWWSLRQEKRNQALLISGASKSGRTTALKSLLEQFLYLSEHQTTANRRLHTDVVKAHILLEYFGNCSTSTQASSTHFGLYTELHFDAHGAVTGTKLADYNLDAGRVTNVPQGECNFHVFYTLCAAAHSDDLRAFKLSPDFTKYAFLRNDPKQPHTPKAVLPLRIMTRAMKALGIKKRLQQHVFAILVGLMHLGNLEFIADERRKEGSAIIRNAQDLDQAAEHFGVSSIDLLAAMTTKTIASGDSVYTDFLDPEASSVVRNELISVVYENLFSYLIERINERLNKEAMKDVIVGIFESEGIRNETHNSMHEFCANYFEERVRFMFNSAMNNEVQSLRNGTDQPISYEAPPAACINLMDNLLGVLSNEAQQSPAVNNVSVLEKLHSSYAENRQYVIPSNDSSSGFGVQHYTGPVVYDIEGFIHKIKNKYTDELVKLFRLSCDNPILTSLFSVERVQTFCHPKRRRTVLGARSTGLTRKITVKNKPIGTTFLSPLPEGEAAAELPLAVLANTYIMEHKHAIDMLTSNWTTSPVWNIICIDVQTFDQEASNLEGNKLEVQFKHLALPVLLEYVRLHPIATSCSREGFISFYSFLLPPKSDDESNGIEMQNAQIQDILALLTYRDGVLTGNDMFIYEQAWLELEAKRTENLGTASGHRVTFKRVISRSDRPEKDEDSMSVASGDIEMGDGIHESPSESALKTLEENAKPADGAGEVDAVEAAAKERRKSKDKREKELSSKTKLTKVRRRWLCYTWFSTGWIPDRALTWAGMPRPDIQMAWREKVALCSVIALLSAAMLFFITGFSSLMCPEQKMYSTDDVAKMNIWKKNFRMMINGLIYDFTGFDHASSTDFNIQQGYYAYGGLDVSSFFPRYDKDGRYFPSVCNYRPASTFSFNNAKCKPDGAVNVTGYCHNYPSFDSRVFFRNLPTVWKLGFVAWASDAVALRTRTESSWIIIKGRIYDVTDLLATGSPLSDGDISIVKSNLGKDISGYISYMHVTIACLEAIAFVGVIDTRNTLQCQISSYILLAFTYVLVGVMIIKFLAALQLGSKRLPEDINKFVIMQVPCYTEGNESLKKTIESLALTTYDDTRKLLFVVADGMVRGSGNEKATPDLVLDILGVDKNVSVAEPLSYHAIGEGSKQHNKAQIYSGLYRLHARAIPFVVVVKCGTEKETSRAGNRGKRDSQMVLMKFLNKVFFNSPMLPAELELFHHIKNIIGVEPSLYEYTLMVDADTEVAPDCMTRLVSWCLNDAKIMGLCGETRISNENQSWITMIQVYEYYISHHLAKAFESLFGSVTCLPGCFSMYRFYSNRDGKRIPLLISQDIITEYSDHNVDTLHKKNLLSLGEDRYLTTLMLKTFSGYRMKFMPDSHCLTVVPEKFSVLLSQRRRWINSTIHNLFELLAVDDLCGCLIFSMRGVVFLDLFATLVMPASVAYLAYMIYLVILDSSTHIQALILVGATYGMQAIIFLIKRQWQHIGWMIIHILSMPVFYLYIPLYSFWHFDDFSWGNTRVIAGEKAGGGHDGDQEVFDLSTIPTMSWDAYQMDKKNKSMAISTSRPYEITKSSSFYAMPNNMGPIQTPGGVIATPMTAVSIPHSSSHRALNRAPSTYSMQQLMHGSDAVLPGHTMHTSQSGLLLHSQSQQSISALASSTTPGPQTAQVYPPGTLPTDEIIMAKIQALVQTRDLNTLTKRGIRDELSVIFGVDLSSKRDYINACIDTLLQG